MDIHQHSKLKLYYSVAILSMFLSVVSFAYNAWRMEVSEKNNNVRTAAFEIIKTLSELEQNIYAAHYDQDTVFGSPRVGWVKVRLVDDLSELCSVKVQAETEALSTLWAELWSSVDSNRSAVDALVSQIDRTREEIRQMLNNLD